MAWVFAYGSLMGDAVLRRYRARPARLLEYRRAFLHVLEKWGAAAGETVYLGDTWANDIAPADGIEPRQRLVQYQCCRSACGDRCLSDFVSLAIS